jgi:hypothetical protein
LKKLKIIFIYILFFHRKAVVVGYEDSDYKHLKNFELSDNISINHFRKTKQGGIREMIDD